ncbi:deoxyhypusine synthase [Pancytospora philotis]|nr:deoxyhypusine synthase [Pancytospora philotis]
MERPTSVKDLSGAKRDDLVFSEPVKGFGYDAAPTLDSLLESYRTTGFQASNLAKAVDEVKRMRAAKAKIFFGCTSNMVSCGLREHIRYLAKNKMFDVMVCTAGGIEEDIIKCLGPTYVADFHLNGEELRENGWNRIGNLVINNANYESFAEWFSDVLDELLSGKTAEYPRDGGYSRESPLILTPSMFIDYLGKKINNEESILYWCHRNGINVYSPALTDGSLGDMLTFYSKRAAFKLDIVEDIHRVNTECLGGHENGAVVIGCGLVKHHVLNANLFHNGLDYCVLVNTASDYDGSDSGATLSEAHSWGKVKPSKTCVKVHGEASIIFPLLVYGGFVGKQ